MQSFGFYFVYFLPVSSYENFGGRLNSILKEKNVNIYKWEFANN